MLGPLYYTDRHTGFQVLESNAREAPHYLNNLMEQGAPETASAHFQISAVIGSTETPLFCVSLILGLGAAWNLAQLDHGLTFDHRARFNTDLFREVRRGDFSGKWFRLTVDPGPFWEARPGPPVTLHIPDRKPPKKVLAFGSIPYFYGNPHRVYFLCTFCRFKAFLSITL